MTRIHLKAVTSRSATLLLDAETSLFHLAEPASWKLKQVGDGRVVEGVSETVPVFLDDLEPGAEYIFTSRSEAVRFTTLPCAGLIDITEFGADVGLEDNAAAIARALEALPQGGTLRVPAGRYNCTPIFLRNNMTLHLQDGAEIYAIGARTNWPVLPDRDAKGRVLGTWEGLPEACYASVITAIDCDNLTLTGRGVIDGGGSRGDWWSWPKETRNNARRPRTIFLSNCKHVTLSGLTVRNSPSWTVHPTYCENVSATALLIENPSDSPNTDGFNPESCLKTSVSGLKISVGDDCIAVKSGKRGAGITDHLAPTRDLTISNCLMERGHGAVVLGSEMSGDIKDVTITRCAFVGTDRGLRIKTRRGRGGEVSGIHLDQVEMDGVLTPLAINAFYFCDPDGRSEAVQSRNPAVVDDTTPTIRDVTLKNVVAKNTHLAGAAVLGLPEASVTGISIQGFQVSYDPDAIADVPLMAANVEPARHAGILAEFAQVSGEISILPSKEPAGC